MASYLGSPQFTCSSSSPQACSFTHCPHLTRLSRRVQHNQVSKPDTSFTFPLFHCLYQSLCWLFVCLVVCLFLTILLQVAAALSHRVDTIIIIKIPQIHDDRSRTHVNFPHSCSEMMPEFIPNIQYRCDVCIRVVWAVRYVVAWIVSWNVIIRIYILLFDPIKSLKSPSSTLFLKYTMPLIWKSCRFLRLLFICSLKTLQL